MADYTTDLSRFGHRERLILQKMLEAWINHGLPEGFDYDGVLAEFDADNGFLFFVNSLEERISLTDSGKLEIWNQCRCCGHEGFLEDCQLNDNGCNECEVHNG